MILSERNRGNNVILQRKYKPVSLSSVLKKPLIITSLPPIYITPKSNTKKHQKTEIGLQQQLSRPSNKLEGLGAVGFSFNPVDKDSFQQSYAILSSKKAAVQVSKKYTSHRKVLIKPIQQELQKHHCTEIHCDKINKWSQTTFDEDQLLEYLNI